nr:NADH dehydrogenase subunit 3 [Penenirmus auritus]
MYLILNVWLVMVVLVSVCLLIISSQFGVSSSLGSEMFECGMNPQSEKRCPVYMHFFHIGILFLIFDIELSIFLPVIWSELGEQLWVLFWTMYVELLGLGLLMELLIGGLSWKE